MHWQFLNPHPHRSLDKRIHFFIACYKGVNLTFIALLSSSGGLGFAPAANRSVFLPFDIVHQVEMRDAIHSDTIRQPCLKVVGFRVLVSGFTDI